MAKQNKQFTELSDEDLKQVTGSGNWHGGLTVTGGAGSGHNPIYALDDNLLIRDIGVCLASQRESCEMNGGTFTTDCHCIYQHSDISNNVPIVVMHDGFHLVGVPDENGNCPQM